MKKSISILLAASLFAAALSGCGTGANQSSSETANASSSPAVSSSASSQTSSAEEIVYLEESQIKELYTSPEKFKGKYVKLTGKVFQTPEVDEKGVYFQMWGDPENNDYNTVVAYADPTAEIKDGDYVIIDGMVTDAMSGTNAYGGSVTAPAILAKTLEVSSYQEVVSPTLKELVPAEATVDQSGYAVTIDKVELAEKETRVYVTVSNNTEEEFHFYKYSTKLVQNGQQFETESNYKADYPDVQTELLPGTTSSGIITFPALDPASDFQINAKGSSGNYKVRLDPYVFEVAAE